jgi:ABC-2 type transport system ATP-binding protein
MDYAIETDGLTKRYRGRAAVDGLSIAVPAGAVAGFVGPNGAGKTTTMGMLLGLVRRTAGDARVLGAPLDDPAAYLSRVGASVERPAFYSGLTAVENLRLLATVRGGGKARIPAVLNLVGLEARQDDRFGGYSMGMKQRLAIAAALLGDPELLVLDEPTNGLDPAAIHEMRELVVTLARSGRTIFVSSHQLSELEQVCDWLVVIERGSLLFQGAASEFGGKDARVVLAPEHVADLDRLASLIDARGYTVERSPDGVAVAGLNGNAQSAAAEMNRAAAHEGIVLVELHVERMSLEERYLNMVDGGQR